MERGIKFFEKKRKKANWVGERLIMYAVLRDPLGGG